MVERFHHRELCVSSSLTATTNFARIVQWREFRSTKPRMKVQVLLCAPVLRGGEVVTRQAHNLENAGAHPAPATNLPIYYNGKYTFLVRMRSRFDSLFGHQ